MDPENSPPTEKTSRSSSGTSASVWQAILEAARDLPKPLLFVIIALVILIIGSVPLLYIIPDPLFLLIFLGLIAFLVVGGVVGGFFIFWHEQRKSLSPPEIVEPPEPERETTLS
jgi:Na+-driven multidrug efflux pump